jgi:hypothetical protein
MTRTHKISKPLFFFLLLIQELIGDMFVYYPAFIGASAEPRRLLKKLDQNFSREKS